MHVAKDPAANRFIAVEDDSELGFMSFVEHDGVVVIDTTIVHSDHQGKGVAGRLAAFGFDWLRVESAKRVVPQCSYAARYVQKHPELAALTTR